MEDEELDVLDRSELLELAEEFASDPGAIVNHLHGGGSYSWDWPVDEDDPSKGKIRIFLIANSNNIAPEQNGATWIRPHQAIILQQFSDGNRGRQYKYSFRPDTPLGIEPDGKPRPTLAGLIRRHVQSATA